MSSSKFIWWLREAGQAWKNAIIFSSSIFLLTGVLEYFFPGAITQHEAIKNVTYLGAFLIFGILTLIAFIVSCFLGFKRDKPIPPEIKLLAKAIRYGRTNTGHNVTTLKRELNLSYEQTAQLLELLENGEIN